MHYRDWTLLPQAEFSEAHVMGAVFQALHARLASMNGAVGVSFPKAHPKGLGDTIRLFGDSKALSLLEPTTLSYLVSLGSIAPVPSQARPLRVRRVQVKSNVERLKRRYMRRHGCSDVEANALYQKFDEKRVGHPFVTLKSSSTQQTFRLFVEQTIVDDSVDGMFSVYGLSQDGSTVFSF